MIAGDPFGELASAPFVLPWVGDCPTCHGLGRVCRALANGDDLQVGDPDFGRDYACPRCTPARYNVERTQKRWER